MTNTYIENMMAQAMEESKEYGIAYLMTNQDHFEIAISEIGIALKNQQGFYVVKVFENGKER